MAQRLRGGFGMMPSQLSPVMFFTGKRASAFRALSHSVVIPLLVWGILFGAVVLAAYRMLGSSVRLAEQYQVSSMHLVAADAMLDVAARQPKNK